MDRRPIRWWPAVLVLTAMAGLLAWVWLREVDSTQQRVVPTFPILILGAAGLFVWLVGFSRLPGKQRLRAFAGGVLVAAAGLALFEIEGVDGNIVPQIGLRFGANRRFDARTQAAARPAGDPQASFAQFYGSERTARLSGPALERDWTAHPPRELWRRPVGDACSSFAVSGAAAVTQELRGEEELVVRYELDTGAQVWVSGERAPFRTTVGGSGPRATPTLDGDRVFALGATGHLSCLDLETGRRIWSRDVLRDHGAEMPDWGMASSPLVAGRGVLVQLGTRGRGLAAYDRDSGEPLWRAGDDLGTYSSPVLATLAGVPQVLVVYAGSVAAHDPETGRVLWSYDWPNPGGERATPPLVLDGERVLVSAGYGVGSRLLQLTRSGETWSVALVWDSPRLKSKFAPLVEHRGTIFGLDDGVLVALDPADGQRRWKAGRYGHGQFLLVGDLLLIQAEDGDLVLAEAAAAGHVELARIDALADKTWNPPALAGRVLLVRNDREAAAYELATGPARAAAP